YGETTVAERPDGQRVHVAEYPTPLFHEGRLVGAVNMLVDITDQQEAEQANRDLARRLKQRVAERTRVAEANIASLHRSDRYFQLLVSNVTDYAIFMLDPKGWITHWNTGAERSTGN